MEPLREQSRKGGLHLSGFRIDKFTISDDVIGFRQGVNNHKGKRSKNSKFMTWAENKEKNLEGNSGRVTAIFGGKNNKKCRRKDPISSLPSKSCPIRQFLLHKQRNGRRRGFANLPDTKRKKVVKNRFRFFFPRPPLFREHDRYEKCVILTRPRHLRPLSLIQLWLQPAFLMTLPRSSF